MKFRLFDLESNSVFSDTENLFLHPSGVALLFKSDDSIEKIDSSHSQYKVQFSSPFLDLTGEEIYEGDVLNIPEEGTWVVYKNTQGEFLAFSTDYPEEKVSVSSLCDIGTVIGSCYVENL